MVLESSGFLPVLVRGALARWLSQWSLTLLPAYTAGTDVGNQRAGTVSTMPGGESEMLTRREAADLLGVHQNTVRGWEQTGRVTTEKAPNGMVMIQRADIERIAAERTETALSDRAKLAICEARLETEITARQDLERRYDALLQQVIKIAGGKG